MEIISLIGACAQQEQILSSALNPYRLFTANLESIKLLRKDSEVEIRTKDTRLAL